MQKMQQVDILREKGPSGGTSPRSDLFLIVHFTLAQAPPAHMPDADCEASTGRVTKIKNRCGDEETHHFVMNGRLSVSPRPAFANVTQSAASGRGHASHIAHAVLFVICCGEPEQERQE